MSNVTKTLFGKDSYNILGAVRQRGVPFVVDSTQYNALSAPQKALFTDSSTFPVEPGTLQKYEALITVSDGGTITATILENSLGHIAWTKSAAGVYIGTLVDGFPAAKTRLTTPNIPDAAASTVVSLKYLTDSTVELVSAPFGQTAADGLLTRQHVLIVVG